MQDNHTNISGFNGRTLLDVNYSAISLLVSDDNENHVLILVEQYIENEIQTIRYDLKIKQENRENVLAISKMIFKNRIQYNTPQPQYVINNVIPGGSYQYSTSGVNPNDANQFLEAIDQLAKEKPKLFGNIRPRDVEGRYYMQETPYSIACQVFESNIRQLPNRRVFQSVRGNAFPIKQALWEKFHTLYEMASAEDFRREFREAFYISFNQACERSIFPPSSNMNIKMTIFREANPGQEMSIDDIWDHVKRYPKGRSARVTERLLDAKIAAAQINDDDNTSTQILRGR